MGDDNNENICVLCCLTFSSGMEGLQGNVPPDYVNSLQKLYASITSGSGNVDSHIASVRERKSRRLRLSSKKSVEMIPKSLVCPNCDSCVTSVLEKGNKMIGMEVKVRKLQLQLLKVLKMLQIQIDGFKQEVRKIEIVVEDSSVNVSHLDKFFGGNDEGEGLKRALKFREEILNVVGDLHILKNDIVLKTGVETDLPPPSPPSPPSSPPSPPSTSPRPPPSISPRSPPSTSPRSPPSISPRSPPSTSPRSPPSTSPRSPPFPYSSPPRGRKLRNRSIGTTTSSRRSCATTNKKAVFDCQGIEAEEDDIIYIPVASEIQNQMENILLGSIENSDEEKSSEDDDDANDESWEPPSPSLGTIQNEDLKLSRNENDDALSDNDKHHDDGGSVQKRKRKGKGKSKTKKIRKKYPSRTFTAKLMAKYDFTGMTPFKKALLRRVIRRAEKFRLQKEKEASEGTVDNDPLNAMNPMKSHVISYDPLKDILILAGYQATINEQEEYIQCSQCNLQIKPWSPTCRTSLEDGLYNHVLGQHLNLFTCPYCPSTLANFKRFKEHVKGHNNAFVCDICGRQLLGSMSLKNHKFSHMNDEEKSEALKLLGKEGDMDPSLKTWMRKCNMEKKFKCPTCGKAFTSMARVRIHEVVHRDERVHMCPNCGKSFKQGPTLYYHMKYRVCSEGVRSSEARQRDYRYQCDKCSRKFPYRTRLQMHKEAVHAESMEAFRCSLCGKGFKGVRHLKMHEQTHSDARPKICRKGCGATFKTTAHCGRHEKKCVGS